MTMASNRPISRRALIAGSVGIASLGLAGLLVPELSGFFARRYAPTPFDDLLYRLSDRENAVRLGSAVLAQEKSFDARPAASRLRAHLRAEPLDQTLADDLRQGKLTEVRGWVLPETLTTLCALAAKVG